MGQNYNNRQNQKYSKYDHSNKRPPRPPMYRGKNVDPMGDPGRMRRHATSLFKDMAHGKAKSIDEYRTLFANAAYLKAAIDEVTKKVYEQNIYNQALNFTYGASTDAVIRQMIDRHHKAHEGWSYILQTLYQIANSNDVTFILGLMNRLPDYKYVLY